MFIKELRILQVLYHFEYICVLNFGVVLQKWRLECVGIQDNSNASSIVDVAFEGFAKDAVCVVTPFVNAAVLLILILLDAKLILYFRIQTIR